VHTMYTSLPTPPSLKSRIFHKTLMVNPPLVGRYSEEAPCQLTTTTFQQKMDPGDLRFEARCDPT
jgi:hypothetical protein